MVHVPGRLLHGEVTDKILKAFYEVADALPYGIPESSYQRALPRALKDLGINCQTEVDLTVYFRGDEVGKYRADLIVENKVVVEIKTAPRVMSPHIIQLAGYLRISKLQVGLVLNFGPTPTFERFFLGSRGQLSD